MTKPPASPPETPTIRPKELETLIHSTARMIVSCCHDPETTEAKDVGFTKKLLEDFLVASAPQEPPQDTARLATLTSHCCCHYPQGQPCNRAECVGAIVRDFLAVASAPQTVSTTEQDARYLQLWRSVSGPFAELTGPLIRFAAALEARLESDKSWLRAQRDVAEEKLREAAPPQGWQPSDGVWLLLQRQMRDSDGIDGIRGVFRSRADAEYEISRIRAEYPDLTRGHFVVQTMRIRPSLPAPPASDREETDR